MNARLRCLFLATPEFALPTLELLHNHPLIDIVGIVSMPDRPAGRGQKLQSPPVIEYAKLHKLTYFQSENINKDLALIESIEKLKVDLIIVFAFAQFLNNKWLAMAGGNVFNIHTSLLPAYRGAAPVQAALLNGDRETGVTIQKMVKKMDAGDIASQLKTPIEDFENGGLLSTRMKFLAAQATHEFLQSFFSGKIIYRKQDESQVSFAPTMKRQDGHLDFEQQNAISLLNKIRAYDPWPGTYCFLNKKRLKVFSATIYDKKIKAGEIQIENGRLLIGAQDKTLSLDQIQPEGKRRMSAQELTRGLNANELKLTKEEGL